ncbi:pentapeptide repeat-containing protein [Arthrobacter sp. I2-34]|uniref:Pentapeptide repeat-containing protein n=1 Tax=Arthrobacter hankyongi TaxID=2904801 RepID=A0ABS9LDJ8_9MICC|nr:pentapeptide repeat-containing protein [Arthrobacter hankyongi]MCG2624740.1 pentapeptide repeat-containing protein [Arthrobacter hankyongi]
MTALRPAVDRDALRPACGDCFALCCTALGFCRSADFAADKPAGLPCEHLGPDFSCGIHDRLRPRGFRGCTVFDCFGAGQVVSQRLFGGVSWRDSPDTTREMFAAFKAVRQLHELLWYLAEARERTLDPDTAAGVHRLTDTIATLTQMDVPGLLGHDIAALHAEVRTVLMQLSEEVRAGYFAAGDDHLEPDLAPGADLMGRNLGRRRLCGTDLRGACLIAADLRGSDLAGADLLGADLRDARLEGADLSAALYLTQPQINAARGNPATQLPPGLSVPPHWTGG